MKHAYFLIFVVQLVSAFPSRPIQYGGGGHTKIKAFCNDLHDCNKMDQNMHCLIDGVPKFKHHKEYLGTCECKEGFTWNLKSCEQNPRSEYQYQDNQYEQSKPRSTSTEIWIVLGIIVLVIIAIVVFAVIMTYCGDLIECGLICFFCFAMCD
eukprot:02297.XXX_53720_54231_1 [CDS] Oithona nana genome sequencing.